MLNNSPEEGDLRVEDLSVSYDDEAVIKDIGFEVNDGRTLALLGPSGSGKTTLLRSIAGLNTPDTGKIHLGSRMLSSPTECVPPEKRSVGMVFQDLALFPHMSVAKNVAYGLGSDIRASKGVFRRKAVGEVLEMVGLSKYANRRISTLSGGQRQRVALARTLAPRPLVVLLDEPFGSLDTALRTDLRKEVRKLLAELGITAIFVTHDQDEAFVLGDQVAVMTKEGRIGQQGSPDSLYRRPNSAWVADFVGSANLIEAMAEGSKAKSLLGEIPLMDEHHGKISVMVRPEQLEAVAGDLGTVDIVEYYGHDIVYVVSEKGGMQLQVRATTDTPAFRRGDRVSVRYIGNGALAFSKD